MACGLPPRHQTVHPAAMGLIHRAYYRMVTSLKEHPEQYETTAMMEAINLARASIKFVTDLGDPRILRHLADPDCLALDLDDAAEESNHPDQVPTDEEWVGNSQRARTFRSPADQEWSEKVREARERRTKSASRPRRTNSSRPANNGPCNKHAVVARAATLTIDELTIGGSTFTPTATTELAISLVLPVVCTETPDSVDLDAIHTEMTRC